MCSEIGGIVIVLIPILGIAAFFGWAIKEGNKDIPRKLCKICKHFEPVPMDVSQELCIFCVKKYLVRGEKLPENSTCKK